MPDKDAVKLPETKHLKMRVIEQIDAMDYQELLATYRIINEYVEARLKHPGTFSSHHEGYAITLEELDEAWEAVRADDHRQADCEMSQVGAMAIRYLTDLNTDVPS